MPNMNGMELVLELRKKYDRGEFGIIVLSGSSDHETTSKFLKIGANDFMSKPYFYEEVSIRVNLNLDLLELFAKERENANRDFLTKAYNRRYFFESGTPIISKSKRSQISLAVVMIDIDKFKNINDTYGHQVGDIALKDTIQILNENLRNSDLIARFGGEEFCILLENISIKDLGTLLEKIRLAFEQNELKTLDYTVKFTISIGACYGIEDTLQSMINIADEQLYFCKNNGRNQVNIKQI
jgi:diguanylate cyclase (GGDEF)-like protein